jgi:hypothetical protein
MTTRKPYFELALVTLSLLACNLTPSAEAPENARIQVAPLNSNPLIAGVQPAHEGQGLPTQAVTMQFTSAQPRADIERRFTLLRGSFTADSAALPAKLGLTAMCNGRWRVRNPNATTAVFVWDVYKTAERGSGIVPANSDVFFETSNGQKTVRVFVGGVQHNTKAANLNACSGALPSVPGRVAGAFSWNPASTELSFTPDQPLSVNDTYTVFLGLANPFASVYTVVGSITVPDEQALDGFMDPALPDEEREDFARVLAQLAPEVRDSLSYLAPNGQIYGSSEEARSGAGTLERVRDNIYAGSDGLYAYPGSQVPAGSVSGARATVRPQAVDDIPWQTLANCDQSNDGSSTGTGPFRRVTAPAGTQNARVNWMQVSVYLPRASVVRRDGNSRAGDDEAGNYQIQTPEGVVTNGPFLYVGGWGMQGRIAADAGFQLSTGSSADNPSTSSDDPNGLWTPFIKAGTETQVIPDPTGRQQPVVLRQLSDKPAGKLRGGQVVSLTFFNLDDILVMVVKGKTQQSGERQQYRVLGMKLTNARQGAEARWRGDGIGNTYKLMTTIAQARTPGGNAQYVAGNGAEGFLKNAAWFSPKIGWISARAPRFNENEERWYAQGQFEDYTVRPDGNAPVSDRPRSLFGNDSIACEFPNNTTPARNVVPKTDAGSSGQASSTQEPKVNAWLLPDVIQQSPNDNALNNPVECVSIDLRQPTGLQISIVPPAITQPWSPQRPACVNAQRAAARPQTLAANGDDLPAAQVEPVVLETSGEPGAAGRQTVTIRNANGARFSSTDVTVYPIGSYPTRVNWDSIPVGQRPNEFPVWQPYTPWENPSSGGWQPSWTAPDSTPTRLRATTSDAPLVDGALERRVEVSGACPSNSNFNDARYNGVLGGDEFQETMYVLYTTGAVDYGTRRPALVNGSVQWLYNDIGTPRVERKAVAVPVRLRCPSLRWTGARALYFRESQAFNLSLSPELRSGAVSVTVTVAPELDVRWTNPSDPNAGGTVACRESRGVFTAEVAVTSLLDATQRGVRLLRVECRPTPQLEVIYPPQGPALRGVDGEPTNLSSWMDLRNTGWETLTLSDPWSTGVSGLPASIAPGQTVRVSAQATCAERPVVAPRAGFQSNIRGGLTVALSWDLFCSSIAGTSESFSYRTLGTQGIVPIYDANEGRYAYSGARPYALFTLRTGRVQAVRGWTPVVDRVMNLAPYGVGTDLYRVQVFALTSGWLPYQRDRIGALQALPALPPEFVIEGATVEEINGVRPQRGLQVFSLRDANVGWDYLPAEVAARSHYALEISYQYDPCTAATGTELIAAPSEFSTNRSPAIFGRWQRRLTPNPQPLSTCSGGTQSLRVYFDSAQRP